MVRWLLKRHALRGSAEALIRACELGHVEVARALLEESTIDPDSTRAEERFLAQGQVNGAAVEAEEEPVLRETALMRATELNQMACCRLLLEAKADAEMRNRDGKTPMQVASERGNWDCMQALLDAKASSRQALPAQLPGPGSTEAVWIRKEGSRWVMGEYVAGPDSSHGKDAQ